MTENNALIAKLNEIINKFYPYQTTALDDSEPRFEVESVSYKTNFNSDVPDGHTRIEYKIFDSFNDSSETFDAIVHWQDMYDFKANFSDSYIEYNFKVGISNGFFNLADI